MGISELLRAEQAKTETVGRERFLVAAWAGAPVAKLAELVPATGMTAQAADSIVAKIDALRASLPAAAEFRARLAAKHAADATRAKFDAEREAVERRLAAEGKAVGQAVDAANANLSEAAQTVATLRQMQAEGKLLPAAAFAALPRGVHAGLAAQQEQILLNRKTAAEQEAAAVKAAQADRAVDRARTAADPRQVRHGVHGRRG